MPSLRSPGRRVALMIAAAVTLVASCLAVRPASAADTLLSQGRTVTASSAENVAFPASAAVDGDAGTRWSSGFADPQWIQVDLGATATITRVSLKWETAYGRAFEIQTSPNGTTWTPIYSTTTGTGGDQTLAVNGSGRYVRMYGTQRGTPYGYSLCEFQVWGIGGAPVTPPPLPPEPVNSPRLVWSDEFNGGARPGPTRPSGPRTREPARTTSWSTTTVH